MKVGRVDPHTSLAKTLLDSHIEAPILLRIQVEIVPENFVLTARRTETGRITRMQRRVGLLDHITAGETISPNIAELIKVIETAAGDQDSSLRLACTLACKNPATYWVWSLTNVGCGPKICETKGRSCPALTRL